jgi:hypothetical protein
MPVIHKSKNKSTAQKRQEHYHEKGLKCEEDQVSLDQAEVYRFDF